MSAISITDIMSQKELKILAIDFDQTLNRINLSFRIKLAKIFRDLDPKTLAPEILNRFKPEEVLSDLFLESAFIKYLRKLKSSGQAKIVVTSFGFRAAVEEVLRRYNLKDLFHRVYTPQSFGYPDGWEHFKAFRGKNLMLEHIMKKYNVQSKKSVLLVDDSVTNINYAAHDGYNVILSDDDGLKKEHGKMIIKYIRLRC